MNAFLQHFWLLLMASTILSAFLMDARSGPHAAADPSLKPGYQKLFWGYLGFANLPLILLALGDLTSGPGYILEFIFMDGLSVLGYAFHLTLALMGIGLMAWVFVGGGDAFLVRHPGYLDWGNMYTRTRDNRAYVKLVTVVLVGSLVAAEIFLWTL